jgi:hypothetical protein
MVSAVLLVALRGTSLAADAQPAPSDKAAPAKAAPAKPAPVAAKPVPVASAPAVKAPAKAAPAPAVAAKAPVASAPAKSAPVASVPAKPAPAAAPVAKASSPAPAVRAASLAGSSAPVVTAVPHNGTPVAATAPHLDDHVTYQYNALGRRDPFQPLVGGAFVGADVGGDAPPDPGGLRVVGIVWGATDQFALVEDVRGNSFVLRKGDKVQNGVVEGLKRDGVIVNITADGQSQSVEIPLVRKGDSNAR